MKLVAKPRSLTFTVFAEGAHSGSSENADDSYAPCTNDSCGYGYRSSSETLSRPASGCPIRKNTCGTASNSS